MRLLRSILAFALLLALGGCAHSGHGRSAHGHSAHGHSGAAANHRFERAEEWAPRFEDPQRDQWQRPDEVLAALALEPTARIADIGAATGYFPVRLARALPQAKVIGVDVEPSMVEYLRRRALDEGLGNIEAVLGTPDDPKIAGPLDLVMLVNTYHHVADRVSYLRRLGPVFAPAGRLAIIDFRPESKMGPDHKLAPTVVTEELARAGYALVQEHAFLPEQYFLVFEVAR